MLTRGKKHAMKKSKRTRCHTTLFPNLFDQLHRIEPRCSPITHERQHVSQKCKFVSIAYPLNREQTTNYN